MNVRPLTALCFGVGALPFLTGCLGATPRRSRYRTGAIFLVPLFWGAAGYVCYNTLLTGNARWMAFTALQPNDRLGFGKRDRGFSKTDALPDFTPLIAAERLATSILPAIGFNATGWGEFRPRPFTATAKTGVSAGIYVMSPLGEQVRLELRTPTSGPPTLMVIGQSPSSCQSQEISFDASAFPPSEMLDFRLLGENGEVRAMVRLPSEDEWRPVGTVSLPGSPLCAELAGEKEDDVTNAPFDCAMQFGARAQCEIGGEPFDTEIRRYQITGAGKLETIGGDLSRSGSAASGSRPGSPEDRASPKRLLLTAAPGHPSSSAALATGFEEPDFDYQAELAIHWRRSVHAAAALPILFPFVLAVVPFFLRSSKRDGAVLLAGIFLATIFGYSFWWFDISDKGITPFYSRYYNEITLLCLLPLLSHGIAGLFKEARLPFRFAGIAALALLSVDTYRNATPILAECRRDSGAFRAMSPPRIQEPAVVFLDGGRPAPLGDFVSKGLTGGGVIYFRLGPASRWGLPARKWEDVYRAYFAGRHPYHYDGNLGRAIRLVPPENTELNPLPSSASSNPG
jgi:hypothetical protein